jgi:hypothetical protein
MWIGIIALLVFIFFGFVVFALFVVDVVFIVINLLIIYLLFYYVRSELKRKIDLYILCALLALSVLLIVGNFLPLWSITTAFLITVGTSQAYTYSTQ